MCIPGMNCGTGNLIFLYLYFDFTKPTFHFHVHVLIYTGTMLLFSISILRGRYYDLVMHLIYYYVAYEFSPLLDRAV